jgi:hypothetical protein
MERVVFDGLQKSVANIALLSDTQSEQTIRAIINLNLTKQRHKFE